ncbi:MAG: HD domain-containing protein [Gemmatimonadota bacterium]
MSAADTIERAARGRLPAWAEMSRARRAHAAGVAALMDGWAEALGLEEADRVRWRAAGWLHDALRDAEPSRLRERLGDRDRELADPVLHGPAAARRLAEEEGVEDSALLDAIAHHTLGHAGLTRLGRALYLADFLEPGRTFAPVARASLRARMPAAFDAVLRVVLTARIRRLIRRRIPLHARTVEFWNTVVDEA